MRTDCVINYLPNTKFLYEEKFQKLSNLSIAPDSEYYQEPASQSTGQQIQYYNEAMKL